MLVKTIWKNKLKNILELDKVDWVSLEKEITDTNFVKIACDYFNEYKGKIRMIDIAKISNIPISTLCTLLKIGARLNMADYDDLKSTEATDTEDTKRIS